MCGLCGVLGAEDHWTDASARPEAFGGAPAPTRRQERLRASRSPTASCATTRLKLADFEGRSYVLRVRDRAPELVPHLAGMWSAAERLAGRPLRPARSRADRRPGAGLRRAHGRLRDADPGQRDHRVSRQRQDHAPQPAAALAAARRHRGAGQRVRRGRARPSAAGDARRRDRDPAERLRVLHHPGRSGGCDARAVQQARARRWSRASIASRSRPPGSPIRRRSSRRCWPSR